MPILPVGLILISAFMHAGWNLLVRDQRAGEIFLRMTGIITALGILPAIAVEFLGEPLPDRVWMYMMLGALFQGTYFFTLSRGYRSGDFTVVYPLGRALPVLMVALADVVIGRPPNAVGWLGLALVAGATVLAPLRSLRAISWAQYWNRNTFWIVLTALTVVGYTVVDKRGSELLTPGALTAARYALFEMGFSFLAFAAILKALRQPMGNEPGRRAWLTAGLAGLLLFGAYWLVLWSYQLTDRASYIIALRQFSIVLGVIPGVLIFREGASTLRIGAAAIITFGIVLIILGG
jgi:drug/metabolite transporter (DMT)-like permease